MAVAVGKTELTSLIRPVQSGLGGAAPCRASAIVNELELRPASHLQPLVPSATADARLHDPKICKCMPSLMLCEKIPSSLTQKGNVGKKTTHARPRRQRRPRVHQ
eukprot:4318575-Pyramimonas_sp.AAC.1